MSRVPRIAVCMGDPNGIGPEISEVIARDAWWKGRAELVVLDTLSGRDAPGRATAASGRASFDAVQRAIELAKRPVGDPEGVDAIVTAPIAKEAWHLAGHRYPGHTELLAEGFKSPRSAMLFVGPSLRVILVTIHVPLAAVSSAVTAERVFDAIELGAAACLVLGVPSPRVAVAGLNPHAGEGGLFGTEDAAVISPAIARARAQGIDCSGPHPGDAVFLKAVEGGADIVVAMYHDQGLIPMKLLDRARTVNVTVGLRWGGRDIVRTSPAHGTAYDIVGRKAADPTSMREAVGLAVRLAASTAP